jgi:hypothetical protein
MRASRNRVVVPARQATQTGGIDSLESILGLPKSLTFGLWWSRMQFLQEHRIYAIVLTLFCNFWRWIRYNYFLALPSAEDNLFSAFYIDIWIPCRTSIYHIRISRECWMIYRGPGFLVVGWFDLAPRTLLPSLVSKLSLFLSLPCVSPVELTDGRGGKGGGGAKSYDGEKAWSSINH